MKQHGFETTAEEVTERLDLSGKTFLVTGCSSGLGLETARVLALRGAEVIGTARTRERAESALREAGARGMGLECELSEPASVLECVAALRDAAVTIDAIVCNAGVMALPTAEPAHGLDLQLRTNHLGHFILVTEALSLLADAGRVVMVSSGAHHFAPEVGIDFENLDGARGYDPWKQYGQSKLANILFAKELAARFEGSGRTANALHPGVIRTNLQRHAFEQSEKLIARVKVKTVGQGAATQCYLATSPDLAEISGEYFSDCRRAEPHPLAEDAELRRRLWDKSEEIARAFRT